jgi:hypothetical protein
MTQRQAFALLLLGITLVTAALTWKFGWIGLLTPGSVVLLYSLIVDQKDPEVRIVEKEVNLE